MSADVTPKDLRTAMQALRTVRREDYSRELMERSARVLAFLQAEVDQLEQRVHLVFRAVDGAFEVGYARSPVVITYPNGQTPVLVAHAAFRQPGRAVDLVPFLSAAATLEVAQAPKDGGRTA